MEKLSLSIFNILSVLSLFAVLLFIFQLYLSKKKNISSRYFSFYLASISVIIFFFLILDLNYKKTSMVLLPLFIGATLSVGPFLWLYVKSVVRGENVKAFKHLFIPMFFGLMSLILLILIFIGFDESITLVLNQIVTYLTLAGLTIVFVLQNTFYIVKCLKLYRKHMSRVGDIYSYTEKVNLKWLKLIVYGYLIFITCLILSNVLDDVWSDILFNTVLLAYIIYSGSCALKYEPIFVEEINGNEKIEEKGTSNKNELFKTLKNQLSVTMNEDKLYLDDALTIHSLATKLNTNSKYLSQLINSEFKKSFVVYINEFRVNEAKALLMKDLNKNLTIEAIGYEAGFKSKSAFNTAFKKFTGETPSSFIKKGK